jgi:hypothetical protein
VLILYSSILTSPWGWRMIAVICTMVHVCVDDLWFVWIGCPRICWCVCLITGTPDRGGHPRIDFPSFGSPVRSLVTISTELQRVTVRLRLVSLTHSTSLPTTRGAKCADAVEADGRLYHSSQHFTASYSLQVRRSTTYPSLTFRMWHSESTATSLSYKMSEK